ncbi:hypothetical protein ACSVDA_04000 [Cytobacillus sp. Hm23]
MYKYLYHRTKTTHNAKRAIYNILILFYKTKLLKAGSSLLRKSLYMTVNCVFREARKQQTADEKNKDTPNLA